MQADEHLEDTIENDVVEENHAEDAVNQDQEMDISEEQENTMEVELEAAKLRAEDNWNQVLLLKAEQDNMRKRSQRDVENAHKFALDKFVRELLPVIDSLEMGLVAAVESGVSDKHVDGTELTLKMFVDVLEKFDVETIEPTGEKFDPEQHQAMTMQENPEMEPNTVIATMQKGYLLNDRLVRPAMVIVSK